MSFERILSFFTEHAPELLLAFVLWWAATAPVATSTPTPTPLQSATPTATLAATPTPEPAIVASAPVRAMTMNELVIASYQDDLLASCVVGRSVKQRRYCEEEFQWRWEHDWNNGTYQLTGEALDHPSDATDKFVLYPTGRLGRGTLFATRTCVTRWAISSVGLTSSSETFPRTLSATFRTSQSSPFRGAFSKPAHT